MQVVPKRMHNRFSNHADIPLHESRPVFRASHSIPNGCERGCEKFFASKDVLLHKQKTRLDAPFKWKNPGGNFAMGALSG